MRSVLSIILILISFQTSSAEYSRGLCEQVNFNSLAEVPCEVASSRSRSIFSPNVSELITRTWTHLGWKSIIIWPTFPLKQSDKNWSKSLYSGEETRIAWHLCDNDISNYTEGQSRRINDFITVIGIDDGETDVLSFLFQFRSRKADSVLTVSGLTPDFASVFPNLESPRSFFHLDVEKTELIHVVVGRNGQTASNRIFDFRSNAGQIPWNEEYDLKGLSLEALISDYEPWERVNDEGRAEGLNVDIAYQLSAMHNFTPVLRTNHGMNWGVIPKNGSRWANCEGRFEGVFQALIDGEFDVEFASWYHRFERIHYVSFSMGIYPLAFVMALNQYTPPDDNFLVFKPFDIKTWIVICLWFFALVGSLVLVKKYFSAQSEAFKIIQLTLWITYITLCGGFYTGSLTMFFTVAPDEPFENELEVMRSFPKWKLIIARGTEIYIQPMAAAGVQEYEDYWRRMRENEGEFILPADEVMDRLTEPGFVLFGGVDTTMAAYGRYGAEMAGLKLQTIRVKMHHSPALVFPKNSPWKLFWDRGLVRLSQKGILQALRYKWLIAEPKKEDFVSTDMNPINFSHIEWPIIFLAIAFIFALLFLAFEFYSSWKGNKMKSCKC